MGWKRGEGDWRHASIRFDRQTGTLSLGWLPYIISLVLRNPLRLCLQFRWLSFQIPTPLIAIHAIMLCPLGRELYHRNVFFFHQKEFYFVTRFHKSTTFIITLSHHNRELWYNYIKSMYFRRYACIIQFIWAILKSCDIIEWSMRVKDELHVWILSINAIKTF